MCVGEVILVGSVGSAKPFCSSLRVSKLPPARTEASPTALSAAPPQRMPSRSVKLALAFTMRDSMATWRTGTSSCAITARSAAALAAVSVRMMALVRSSTSAVPRLENNVASPPPLDSSVTRSAAFA